MKKVIGFIFVLSFIFTSFALGRTDIAAEAESDNVEYAISAEEIQEPEELKPLYTLRQPEGDPLKLQESWGYVMQNRRSEYHNDIPLTDICYFAAEINSYGELVGAPRHSTLDVGKARCHMVVVCESASLTHFILDPKFGLRNKLIKDIVRAGAAFDGVQIDFELVPARDRKNFITFLSDLRYSLGSAKWFTVCLPARTRLLTDDIYPYAQIAAYCDRVFIMAYDEAWSGSKPGPVASVDWCRKVMEYAQKSIPAKKLIMGLPLYGRTWASETTAGAWYFSGANRIMTEHKTPEVVYENDIPSFKYTTNVEVTGYFNDTWSVLQLARLYEEAGIKKLGFWRIGMEDPDLWNWVKISK